MATTSETTSTDLPLNPTSVTTTNMAFSNNQAVATDDNASIAIVPIPQTDTAIFSTLTPSLVYQPKGHTPLAGSSVNQLLVDSTLVDNLNSNNYTTIDLDINNELVSLEINKDIGLQKVTPSSLQPNNFSFPKAVAISNYFQTNNYAYMIDQSGNVYEAPLLSNGDVGFWTNTNNNIPGYNGESDGNAATNGCIIVGNYVYVYNGYTNYAIYYTEIAANGSIGEWIAGPQIFTGQEYVYGVGFFNSGNILYFIISSSSLPSNAIYSFTIASDGSLTAGNNSSVTLPFSASGWIPSIVNVSGVWFMMGCDSSVSYVINIDSTTNEITSIDSAGLMPAAIKSGAAINLNGVLYYFGGVNPSSDDYVSSIYQGTISGTSITWAQLSLSMPNPIAYFGIVTTTDYLFFIAGIQNIGGVNSYTSAVQQLGYIGNNLLSFVNIPTIPNAIANACSFAYDNYAYLLGGKNSSADPVNTVYYFYINSENGIGDGVPCTNLPIAVYDAAVVAIGTTAYLIGGNVGSSTNSSAIYSGTISSSGNITGWAAISEVLPVALAGMACCYSSTAIYLVGGYIWDSTTQTAVDTVYMIPISSTGTLGTPVLLTVTLPTAQYYCSSVIMGNLIYVSDGSSGQDKIHIALINSDDTINDFGNFTNSLPSNSDDGLLLTQGNFLYFIGANSGQIYQCSVELNAVTPWLAINTTLPGSYTGMTGFTTTGYMFIFGGYNGGYLDNIYSFNYTDNNYYTLLPVTPFTDVPNAIYLLGNLEAKGLIGDLEAGDSLATLETNSRGISEAVVTYNFNPIYASNPNTGGNVYYQINNLNNGDIVQTLSGAIGGTILPTGTSTTTSTTSSSS